ncbi:hypothetical protein IW261DRAFT_1569356 [Armillaria novae-zelandiae]|uniref:F-box domain-containing protein n=1 Tax=Armillaria novae-zelandiae TaxID=153914 RepID=A0AA39NY40_9AGAR|nr:hypothetical protein IW261DRAFT_1569356 [Armillaria novae-zelandiae]
MSAKLHLTRNTKPTSVELPPEIWALVFDWATHVPGAYDPDCLPRSFTHPPSKAQDQDRKKSLRSRSSLVRVCKAWSGLALKNLFEHIVIASDPDTLSLCNTLLRSRDDAESSRTDHHLGCYTKRLDISFQTDNINKDITDLGDIIRCFPNLSFITISLDIFNPPQRRRYHERDGAKLAGLAGPILDALSSTCTSLEVLEIPLKSLFYISNSDLHRVFSSFSKLRSFRNEGGMLDLLGPGTPLCFHLATSLTTVALDDRYDRIGDRTVPLSSNPDTFPSLQTVIFYIDYIHVNKQFLSFIQIHGSTLTTIMIQVSEVMILPSFFQELLDTIRTRCPRVVNFMIWFQVWNWMMVPVNLVFQMPPSIRVFGIRCKELQAESWLYEDFFARVIPWNGRVLRLLDERHVTDLCQKHTQTFKRIQQRLEPGGWQFQGPDERVLL